MVESQIKCSRSGDTMAWIPGSNKPGATRNLNRNVLNKKHAFILHGQVRPPNLAFFVQKQENTEPTRTNNFCYKSGPTMTTGNSQSVIPLLPKRTVEIMHKDKQHSPGICQT